MAAPATGAPIGRALSDVIARVLVQHQQQTAPGVAAAKTELITGVLEQIERELAPTMRGFLGFIVDDPDAPDHVKALLSAATGPTHQVDALVQLLTGLVGGALMIPTFAAPSWQQYLNGLWAKNPHIPLSPSEAASAAVRGAMDYDEAAGEAAKTGISPYLFGKLWQLAGEPPATMQLLEAYRRNIITEGRLEQGIRESRVRTDWTDVIKALRFAPMSPGDAISAAVQSHLDVEAARAIAAEGGLLPAHFDPLYETAGNPPGPETMLDWMNRGLADQPTVEQALRESRLKNKYIPAFIASRRRLPPERTVVSMVRKGVLSPADGTQHLLNLGFHPVDAAALISEATTDKVQTEKDLAKGEVTQLYATGTISKDQAIGFLGSLRYSTEEANFILGLVDTAIARASVQSAITKIRSLYVAYRIDRTEASSDLDQLGVAQVKRDELLHVWDLERDANAKDLTLTDVRALVRAGLIDLDNFNERVIKLGYSKVDADLLTQLEANR